MENRKITTEEQRKHISTSNSFILEIYLDKLKDMGLLDAYLKRRGKTYEYYFENEGMDYITISQARSIGLID